MISTRLHSRNLRSTRLIESVQATGRDPDGSVLKRPDDAIGYAKARAKFGRGEIRVLTQDGSTERVIPFGA
jgi:hypothetical protein